MSLELSEGKVKVNFDLGSGIGNAITVNRHNDGRWKSLTMSRNKKQGRRIECISCKNSMNAVERSSVSFLTT